MLNAIVASEDTRFYSHHGVDPRGVLRAFVNNSSADGDNQQGASTLTMQYVRLQTSYTATSPQEVLDATAGHHRPQGPRDARGDRASRTS